MGDQVINLYVNNFHGLVGKEDNDKIFLLVLESVTKDYSQRENLGEFEGLEEVEKYISYLKSKFQKVNVFYR